ncbi:MAG TPA: hypothetical protein VJ805_08060 [Nitrospiraceae bacterium]|nr:hypothetical protein [Nitrospiraceae bacterium]
MSYRIIPWGVLAAISAMIVSVSMAACGQFEQRDKRLDSRCVCGILIETLLPFGTVMGP